MLATIQGNTFYETAAILSLAAVLGVIGQKLRQPLIIMFLATGILAGPAVSGLIRSYDQIELLAHIGISLLGRDGTSATPEMTGPLRGQPERPACAGP